MNKNPILTKASRPKKITVNSIKTTIPPMRTTGLDVKKKDLPIITEDPFENESGDNIGVDIDIEDKGSSDTRLTDDVLGFTDYNYDMDVNKTEGGRKRRKSRRRKSKKSKRRRRSRRR